MKYEKQYIFTKGINRIPLKILLRLSLFSGLVLKPFPWVSEMFHEV